MMGLVEASVVDGFPSSAPRFLWAWRRTSSSGRGICRVNTRSTWQKGEDLCLWPLVEHLTAEQQAGRYDFSNIAITAR